MAVSTTFLLIVVALAAWTVAVTEYYARRWHTPQEDPER